MTNDFTRITDADPEMTLRAQQEVLRAAVGRQMFCSVTKVLLDVRDAVYVTTERNGAVVVTGAVWDQVAEQFADKVEEIYDGRVIFA